MVVFTSDNGGLRKFADNGPLRGQKGELYEGGIRVPMIAWSGNPRLVDSGTINHTPIFAADYHPTLAALARTTPPAVDGRDLSPLIRDADADLDRDALYWHLPGYLIDEARNQHPQSVIRSRQWKLIYSYEDQGFELYDLGKDIGETTDLAAAQPSGFGRSAQAPPLARPTSTRRSPRSVRVARSCASGSPAPATPRVASPSTATTRSWSSPVTRCRCWFRADVPGLGLPRRVVVVLPACCSRSSRRRRSAAADPVTNLTPPTADGDATYRSRLVAGPGTWSATPRRRTPTSGCATAGEIDGATDRRTGSPWRTSARTSRSG